MQEQFQNLGSAIGNIFGSVSGAKEAITHFLGNGASDIVNNGAQLVDAFLTTAGLK